MRSERSRVGTPASVILVSGRLRSSRFPRCQMVLFREVGDAVHPGPGSSCRRASAHQVGRAASVMWRQSASRNDSSAVNPFRCARPLSSMSLRYRDSDLSELIRATAASSDSVIQQLPRSNLPRVVRLPRGGRAPRRRSGTPNARGFSTEQTGQTACPLVADRAVQQIRLPGASVRGDGARPSLRRSAFLTRTGPEVVGTKSAQW